VAPAGEQPAQFGVAEPLLALFMALLLQRQGLVEDESAAPAKRRMSRCCCLLGISANLKACSRCMPETVRK
jgi:hypothetical protein